MHRIFYIETFIYYFRGIDSCINLINKCIEDFEKHQIENPTEEYPIDIILNSLQDFINFAGNISKMLWPIKKEELFISRGKEFRELIEVEDESILKNRDIRNAVEHFDEKLDLYLEKFPVGTIYPKYVGPYESYFNECTHFFRAYFTDTSIFQILNTKIEINPLIIELNKIRSVMAKKVDLPD